LKEACGQCTSFAELDALDIPRLALDLLSPGARRQLETLTPERVNLPGKRSLEIHYELDKPPWVQSRLQDFFGSKLGPSILDGQLPLLIHLLAPNRRAVQVTTDLAGFWQRHYPELRRQLMRRYPRHPWPENPESASPPPPRR
jgi:ATP-dependent helicase HrpB